MNGPKASNAVETNDKLFGPYARKLESDNLDTYTTFSEKLAKWLADERAYYPAARPQILRLLKIAQLTLRRNVNADLDFKAPFHISSCVEHPMVAPYSTLLKAVHPHKDLFVEPDLHAEVKALLKTITTSVPPVHIDLTSEPDSPSPIEPSPVHTENFIQSSSSSPASALPSPPFSLVHSSSAASVPHHSQPPYTASQTNANFTAVVEVSRASRGASDPIVSDTYPGNSVNGDFSNYPIHSGSASFVENTKVPFAPNALAPSHAASSSSPLLSSMTSAAISKVKKKKKKAGFGLESLIQADIQDLQKRGVAGVNIKVEPTNVTIPSFFINPVSHSDPSHHEVIVLDDDNPATQPSEIAPHPSSSNTVQLLQVEQTGTLETTINGANMAIDQVLAHHSERSTSHINDDGGADMAVDQVSAHHSERSTSHINGDSGADMVVDQVPPQLSEHHEDNIDIDMTDRTSRTPLVMKGSNLTSQTTSPIVHGWAPPQRLDESGISTKVTADDSRLKAAAILDRDTKMEPTPSGSSTVPDAMMVKDSRSSESNIASRNVTSNTSLDPSGSQSVTRDAGYIPLVTTLPMVNGLYPVKSPESALLPLKTNNAQLLPNTVTAVSSAVSSSESSFHPSTVAFQNSTSPSPIVPTSVGSNDLLSASSECETILADITTTTNGISSERSSSQHPFSSVPPPSTTEGSEPHDDPVSPPTREQLRALHAFGPDTRTLLVYKGVNQRRLRFKIRFSILEEQYHAITRWNNRKNPAEDLSMCTCASLACYSRASARSEQKGIDEISDLPVVWPTGGSLSMNVMYRGQLTMFPLSPPFKVGPNGMVDVSEYICLGENVIEFDQFDDMSPHIFILRLHRPTGAQLEQVAERRQKNKAWDDWLLKMAEPMVVRLPPS